MTQLRTRRLGRTGLLVTELSFGAASVTDVPEGEETAAQRERLRKRAQAFLAEAARAV